MSETDTDKLSRLECMTEPDQQTWDLSQHDQEAISYALHLISSKEAEIERLRAHGNAIVQQVKNLSVCLFGIEGTWRDSKASWWVSLVKAVDKWEAGER